MHDPSFLAVEIHSPIPVRDRWASRQAREGHRHPMIVRGTGPGNKGKRVHPWWQLQGYRPRIGNHVFRFPALIEAWHNEPGGRDAGTVCRDWHGPRGIRWIVKHRAHLSWRFMPYIRVRHMLDRCYDCKRRFGRRARFGVGWDGPITICNECSRIRSLRSQVSDLAKYVRRENDWTEGWRVERAWLGRDGKDAQMVKHFADLGVGRSSNPFDEHTRMWADEIRGET